MKEDVVGLVRELRARLGLSQEKFAACLGVSFPSINRWENARAVPSQLAMQRIEQLLKEMGDKGRDLLAEHFPKSEL